MGVVLLRHCHLRCRTRGQRKEASAKEMVTARREERDDDEQRLEVGKERQDQGGTAGS